MDPALTSSDRPYHDLSFWHASLDEPLEPRPPLPGDVDADVAIVGAGYTGLWSAYYLAQAAPGLRIAVVEREVAGFGASGRNGGWCSALFPASLAKIARGSSAGAAVALHRAMVASVDEVGRAAAAEGIDCHYVKGGTVVAARSPVQLARARAEVAQARRWGVGEEHLRLLDAAEATDLLRATGTLGATYTPDCAALHPGRLVRGLADAVTRRGVRIYEGTTVTALRPGRVTTDRGTVRADVVLRATEGYTATLPGHRRALAPVYSLVLATQPLPPAVWDEIGLRRRQTFADHRHLVIYGQRTADDRIVFGGRGAPYHYGSRVEPGFDRDPRVFADLKAVLVDLFPVLDGVQPADTWGGPLGIPRDWYASVGLERRTGLGWAGGYVGDGVATSNLAGRTFADLVLDRDTALTRLPWVNRRSRRWEPEPLRWIGTNLGLRVMTGADNAEARTGRPSRRAALFGRLLGQ